MLLALIVMSATVVMRAESSAQHHGHNHNHKHDHRQGNSIYGHVIDDVTEDDIAYAAVLIVETGQGLNTDEYGKFQFNHIPEGEYTLRVQLIGYHTQELKVKVSKDVPLDVHVKMPVEGLLTEEVVVSASRNAVRRCEAPVVVNVLNTKTFEQTNSTDLAKSLNYQSGLRVENSCQNCAFPQVRINGLEGPYSQILINLELKTCSFLRMLFSSYNETRCFFFLR